MATFAPYAPPLAPTSPEPIADQEVGPAWSPATRIAFRFCMIYFGLYVITTQMMPGMALIIPDLGAIPPMRNLTLWVGHHLLGIATIPMQPSGSGDRLFNWTHAFTILLIAAISTVIWSVVARRRLHHERAFAWFRLFLRLAVATTFLGYGFAKVVPLQMPILTLTRLVEPFGNFSPMGVLWYSVGASPAYEIATGSAEVLAGLLLFLPRTTTVGALVAVMDATMIFLLNMTYDVPVKLFSFHLILMALFLLAPNARRLFDLFILHRPAALRSEPPVPRSASGNRRAVIAQAVYGVLMVGLQVQGGIRSWHAYGGGAPKSALYGIWDVKEMAIGGAPRPALLGDTTLVKRVIFQQEATASLQMMDDSFRRFNAKVDTAAKQLTLTTMGSGSVTQSPLSYQRPDHEHLLIDGMIEGRMTHLVLQFRDPDSFLQRSRGFHWIQELPFNR